MKKRFSAVIAVFFALSAVLTGAPADEKKLLSKVPVGAEGVLSADMSALSQLPALKKGLAESRDYTLISQATGLTISDLGALVYWGKGGDMALLAAFSKPFTPEKVFAAPFFSCKKSTVSGFTLYCVKSLKKIEAQKNVLKEEPTFWVAVLPGNVIGFFPDSEAAVNALKMMKGKCGFKFADSVKGSLRGWAKIDQTPFLEAFLSCNVAGKKKSDFKGTLTVVTPSAEEAKAANVQLKMLFSMFVLQAMQDQEELAYKVTKALKFRTAGSKINVTANFPEALLLALSDFLSKKVDEQKAAAKDKKSGKRKGKSQKTTGDSAR